MTLSAVRTGAAACCGSIYYHGAQAASYVGGGLAAAAAKVTNAAVGVLSFLGRLAAAGWHQGGAFLAASRASFAALSVGAKVGVIGLLVAGVAVLAARHLNGGGAASSQSSRDDAHLTQRAGHTSNDNGTGSAAAHANALPPARSGNTANGSDSSAHATDNA